MNKEEIERINSLDINVVATDLGLTLRRKGAHYVTNCLWHQDRRPSLQLYNGSGQSHCHCFACGCHHTVIDMAMAVLGCDFKTACQYLASRYGILLTEGRHTFTKTLLPSIHAMPPQPKPVTELTFGMEEVASRHRPDHNFWHWLTTHVEDHDRLQQVFDAYWLGTTRPGIYKVQPVIFWYIDAKGVVHDGKIMWYKANGHREQWMNWTSALMGKKDLIPQGTITRKCFYGEHLLASRPEAIVRVVESEKSAIFMACHHPEYLWLATGGCNNLNDTMLAVLKGRQVEFLPDSGKYEDWCQRLSQSCNAKDFTYLVSRELEAYPENTDLVDVLLGEA